MNLKELRERAGFSQNETSKLLNVSQAAVCLWEKGKTMPEAKKLEYMATLYKCSTDELLKAMR